MYRPPHFIDLATRVLIPSSISKSNSTYWLYEFNMDYVLVYINISEAQVEDNGIVEMHLGDRGINFLENHFLDPFFPTEDELALYKLEEGCEYPMLKYLRDYQ